MRLEFAGQESVLFIGQANLERAKVLLNTGLKWRHQKIELNCFGTEKETAIACYFRNQRDLGLARTVLQQHEISAYESDVRPTDRYLMERFIRGTLEITGEAVSSEGYLAFNEPQIKPVVYEPDLSIV